MSSCLQLLFNAADVIVKGEFFHIMFIQIGTDFLKFREGTVGMSVSIFFFLPEKKLGGEAVQ